MENTAPKKPQEPKSYAEPTLTEYGSVRELTKQVAQHGNADGGTSPRTNTSLT